MPFIVYDMVEEYVARQQWAHAGAAGALDGGTFDDRGAYDPKPDPAPRPAVRPSPEPTPQKEPAKPATQAPGPLAPPAPAPVPAVPARPRPARVAAEPATLPPDRVDLNASALPLKTRDVVSRWGPLSQSLYVRCPRFLSGAVVFDPGHALEVPDAYGSVEALVGSSEQAPPEWVVLPVVDGLVAPVGFVWALRAEARHPHGLVDRAART